MTTKQTSNPVAAKVATRDHALDAARGLLMILGIFLHAGNIYSVGGSWIVSDPQTHEFFDAMVSVIHVFRMPAFFWISGYFCAMIYMRTSSALMMKTRLPRLAIPLLTSWIILNGGQDWLMSVTNPQFAVEKGGVGIPLYHLWFLIDLILMTAIGGLIAPWLKAVSVTSAAKFSPTRAGLVILVVLFTYMMSVSVRATGFAYATPWNLTSLYRLSTYMPFFVIGMYMQMEPRSRMMLISIPSWTLLLTLPCAVYFDPTVDSDSKPVAEGALLMVITMTWLSVGALLGLFSKVFQKSSMSTRLLSDSAYSIYLFHHPIVVFVGLALVSVNIGAGQKFLIVCLIAFLGPMALHLFLIRKVRLLAFLFNGKG